MIHIVDGVEGRDRTCRCRHVVVQRVLEGRIVLQRVTV
jgi:hypothetical protein